MSLHADATATLTGWTAPSVEQEILRTKYLEHLSNHDDAVWRSCHPDHLTASVIIFSSDHTRALLTLHGVIGRWLQTGGHCEEDDPTLQQAALREGREESGIAELSIDPVPLLLSCHEVPCGPTRPAHHLDVQFVAVAPAGAQETISAESLDLQWFDVEALPLSTDASVHALTAAGVERLRGNP